MEIQTSDKAKWIEEGKLPSSNFNLIQDNKLDGSTIAHCIPPIFDSYCKILHPFEITSDEPDFLELSPDFYKRRTEYKLKNWEKISWKIISAKYGLEYHNQISLQTFINKFENIGFPKNLTFPEEGHLPVKIFKELINILKPFELKDEVYSYQVMPHSEKSEYDVLVKCSF